MKFKKFIIPIIIIAAIAGFFIFKSKKATDIPENAPQIVEVMRGEVSATVSATGVLTPITTINLSSNVGGEIVEINVEEGDIVKAGQIIAKIDPSDLQSDLEQAQAENRSSQANLDSAKQSRDMQYIQTQSNIESAKQSLESAKKRLAQAQKEYDIQPTLTNESIKQAQTSLENAQANLSQIKNASNPQRLASAKSAYESAQASYNQNKNNLSRKKELHKKGFLSQSELDSAQEAYDVAQAQLSSAKKTYDTADGECNEALKSAQAQVDQARSALKVANANKVQIDIKKQDLEAAKASVKQAEASLMSAKSGVYQNQMREEAIRQADSQIVKSRAVLENAQTQLGYTTIKAPRDGVIINKYAEVGSVVTAGRSSMGGSGQGITIVDIADISRMQVVVNVDETDIAKIKMNQEVEVTVDVFSEEKFEAKVVKIAPMAEVEQNVTTIPVTVELAKTDNRLKPEMNATCDFIIRRAKNVLYLPIDAVTMTDKGAEVNVVKGGHEKMKSKPAPPEQKIVKTGISGDDYIEIVEGLKEKDKVIIPEVLPDMDGRRMRRPPRMF